MKSNLICFTAFTLFLQLFGFDTFANAGEYIFVPSETIVLCRSEMSLTLSTIGSKSVIKSFRKLTTDIKGAVALEQNFHDPFSHQKRFEYTI